ncbi:DUF6266 family protein [Labilibaculum antarcticum]|uniref:Uncharacterized protein n=1 Tax=Labilibaculum antarcticum TaxID=1717717 RepID=A0A1Y1CQI6_9BACT|nr:DUF6266 family protein [Labilibaculum antarcticum]BAX82645.1 hypothetical protein ALGA_4355 [Labilibaculum antarcticum]
MANIKDKLLTGLVGQVIISHRYGKTYLRSKPTHVKNPRTPGQVNQRGKFKAASNFVSLNLVELIRPFWNPEARRNAMSGQNLFCKLNTHAFTIDGVPDMAKLKLTSGDLGGIEEFKAVIIEKNSICFNWHNNSRDKKTSDSNEFKLFGMNANLKVEEISTDAIRKSETFLFDLNENVYSYLFCFFWNPKLELASESEWVDCSQFWTSEIKLEELTYVPEVK